MTNVSDFFNSVSRSKECAAAEEVIQEFHFIRPNESLNMKVEGESVLILVGWGVVQGVEPLGGLFQRRRVEEPPSKIVGGGEGGEGRDAETAHVKGEADLLGDVVVVPVGQPDI